MPDIFHNIKQIVIASSNKGKIKQIRSIEFFKRFILLTAEDVGLTEVEETEDTLEGNALLKARHCFQTTGLPSLSDDTGFFINALGGFPGIHCARLAGPVGNRDFNKAASIINNKLGNLQDRSCVFVSAVAFVTENTERTAQGSKHGTFIYPGIIGSCNYNGGYNPYFIPKNLIHTYAQTGIDNDKNINHRIIALRNLIEKLHAVPNT